LLVSWCVGDRCDIAGSDEDLGRIRIVVQKIRDSQPEVRYSVAG
jgi:hypothetical protein